MASRVVLINDKDEELEIEGSWCGLDSLMEFDGGDGWSLAQSQFGERANKIKEIRFLSCEKGGFLYDASPEPSENDFNLPVIKTKPSNQ